MKITDYIKLERMKDFLLFKLEEVGLKEQVKVMTDEDLDKIVKLSGALSIEMRKKETDEAKLEFLLLYIICLWVKLVVDYGAKLSEL